MSSGSWWLSRFSLSFPRLLVFFAVVPVPGRLILAPFVAGAKSSADISFRFFSDGARKFILKTSFFSFFLGALFVALVSLSAEQKGEQEC